VIHFTGYDHGRSLIDNFYMALGIIAIVLCSFMTYGLYNGISIIDDKPKFKKSKWQFSKALEFFSDFMFDLDIGEFWGLIIRFFLWVLAAILLVVMLVVVEALLWIAILFILPGLYWLFFNAYQMVFRRSVKTKGDWFKSILYSIGFTILYTGWLYAIAHFAKS
jgi:hypothetical protein